jgi:hypothetical protein
VAQDENQKNVKKKEMLKKNEEEEMNNGDSEKFQAMK